MYVLVPDDPVFFAKFQSLEEPILRRLYLLQCTGPETDDERTVAAAYDSWVQILLRLPLWSRWQTGDTATGAAPGPGTGHLLHGPRGDLLTSLYPIEVTAAELAQLNACLGLFGRRDGTARDAAAGGTDAGAAAAPPDHDEEVTDSFRRIMAVLSLSPPPLLLGPLLPPRSGTGARTVTLRAEQETAYRAYCEAIVTILSAGDTFAYRSHRAMYL
ncbi:hypothetical protein ACIBL6_22720 [Streptomyces sp. NPDC050400]|uniref:hypothetical protein n=1 Tax=Streptomyces sp. NPDC050400 TaxID=3365610 RepID=UPI003794D610